MIPLPLRVEINELHTLQNRFYLHNHAFASLQTTIPLLIDALRQQAAEDPANAVDCIAFPDDGAAKRFSSMFQVR